MSISAWINPFVTTLLIKPMTEPNPIVSPSLNPFLLISHSAITAPKKGPIIIPRKGITNGPTKIPIVLPQIPAFEPPYFFIPNKLATKSATNNNRMNKP